ncbi:MAG: hypothetical protein ACQEVT_14050 [Pseudomonadota bacterium]|uniref:hypothetical protein n=1 Tax=Roseovarius TaxID=74030 RepID=UPI0022A81D91|nr:hypothetical protein [Roseovarius sp. EGI FJ00037]MCZ0813483.1 hypothetical protein [Roseovarius sp. EGI FJ00037]
MSDTEKATRIIPTEVQRQEGNVINQSAQQIDPAGRYRVDVNANTEGELNTKQPGHLPKYLPPQGPDPVRDRKTVREAGPKEMENPPERWDEVDEETDQTFPASDPPAN